MHTDQKVVIKLPPAKCAPSPAPSQTSSPGHLPFWLRPTLNCQY